MRSYRLSDLAVLIGGKLQGDDRDMQGLSWDSRSYDGRADRLFIALRGERHDGHDYLEELKSRGLEMALAESLPEEMSGVLVENTLQALQEWAAKHRATIEVPIMAITGSHAKTAVKDRLYELLAEHMEVCRSPRSFNSQLGVPLSVLAMEAHHELGLFEAGISQVGEMKKLAEILRPDLGLFTALGDAHDEHFTSRQSKLDEKLNLFKASHGIIYCKDHEQVAERIRERYADRAHYDWGRAEGAWLHIIELEQAEHEVALEYCTGGGVHQLRWRLPEGDYLENELHCVTAMHVLGLDNASIQEALNRTAHHRHELELLQAANGRPLWVDNDLIDAPSLRSALEQLDRQRTGDQSLVVLYQQEGRLANERRLQTISELKESRPKQEHWVLIGSALEPLANSLGQGVSHFGDLAEAEESLRSGLSQADQTLLKGVWDPSFPVLRSLMESVSHPTEVQVDMEAIVFNLNQYRRRLLPGTRLMAMVKAFAYGSGDSEVAHLLAHQGVDYLAVAYPSEGVALRKRGIQTPIMVLHSEVDALREMIHYRLEPQVHSLAHLDALIEAMPDGKDIAIHLEFDTGMHRLGLEFDEADVALDKLRVSPALRLESVFSHLLGSDDQAADDWSKKQLEAFALLRTRILAHPHCKERTPWFHILNSSGIGRFPAHQYEMVRLGIGLYGMPADDAMRSLLKPALRWTTKVAQLRRVSAGETVGYGGRFRLEKDTVVAVIPVGYADGLSRSLGNGRGGIFIQGQQCPFIGNICMDMSMVDVSGMELAEGAEVIIAGEEQSMEDIARDMGTIAYEVMSGIPQRVKRRYVNNRSV